MPRNQVVADAVCEDTGTRVHDEDTATVVCGGKCGDLTDDCSVDMTDVMILWYDFVNYPSPGVWQINCCD